MKLVAILALLIAPGARAQESSILTVGTAKAARGEKIEGAIEVPAGSDGALRIPVAVAHGARPGPVVALVAGSHGTEYASIVALVEIISKLDAKALAGSVIVVPIINLPSFDKVVPHLNPIDGKNMNRTYPGRPDGSQSERASGAVTREVVEQCDHLIDFHGGDIDEDLRPYTYWNKTGREEQDRVSRGLALAFGLDHIIITTGRPSDPKASIYLENTASTRGKPSITVEAGRAGTVEPGDVGVLVEGTFSVLRHLKMLEGAPTPVENPVWIAALHNVPAESGGIFRPVVARGSYVQKGMKIGVVTDFFGKTLFEAKAPESGVVLYIRAIPSAVKGDNLASIGAVQP